jgi:hypothetical protein
MFDVVYGIFNLSCLAAGLCGAIVHVYNIKGKVSARDVMGYLVTGMLAANFVAPQVLRMISLFPIELTAFGVGMAGKHICLGIEMFFSKFDLFGKTKNE